MEELISTLDPERLTTLVVTYIPKLFAGLVIFLIFWVLTRITRPPLRSALRRAEFEPALINLLIDNVYRISVLLVGILMAVSQFGVDVGAAIAGLGVAGIAVGFAAQDSLANTIAGFLIFWDKPFQVGHVVETQDEYGTVTSITLRTTRIRTPDNTYVVIPNKQIIEDVLINHTMYGESRIRVPLGIAYKEDVAEARKVIHAAVEPLHGVAQHPPMDVVVTELGSSSVNLHVRVWVANASQERPVFFRVLEASKKALDEAGIQIPFPHLQLYVDEVAESVWERAGRLRALETPERENGGAS